MFSALGVTLACLMAVYTQDHGQKNQSQNDSNIEQLNGNQTGSEFISSDPMWPSDINISEHGILGMMKFGKSINWYTPQLTNGDSLLKFGIKHSYNKECLSKADFKQNAVNCLQMNGMFLEEVVSKCRIVITGDNLVNIYRKLFANYTLMGATDAHMVTINTCKDAISITDFFVFPKSKESNFKFLPFEVDHFQHMLEFDLSLDSPESTNEFVSINIMNKCLPKLSTIMEDVVQDIGNCSDAVKLQSFIISTKTSKNVDQSENRLTFLRKRETVTKPQRAEELKDAGCVTSANGAIVCSAAHHLDRSHRHLYMIALYVQVYFIAEYLDEDPYDLEVCIIDKMASRNHQRWFWGRLTASSTSKTERFTLLECCSMTRKLKVYDQPNSAQKVSWVCHDPYRVANTILVCVNIGSYVAVMLFPLCVRFLPPLRVTDSHECCSKHKKKHSKWSFKKYTKDPEQEEQVQPTCQPDKEDTPVCCPNGSKVDVKADQVTSPTATEGSTPMSALQLPMPTVCVTNEEDIMSEVSEGPCSSLDAGGHRPYVPPHDLLFLDSDPVYSFGFKTILSHLMLFHIENWLLIVVRRFLFFYGMWVLVHFASVIVNFYYPALLVHYQVFYYQFNNRFQFGKKQSGEDFNRMFSILVFVVPLCFASIHFVLLSPILLKEKPVSKLLSWDDNESHIGSTIGMESQYLFYKKSKPCEMSFLMLLRSRMNLYVKLTFWKFLFNTAVFKLPEWLVPNRKKEYEDKSQPTGCYRYFLLGWFYFMKLPIVLFMSVIYTVPFFVFHRELLVNPSKFLPPSLSKLHVIHWIVVLMTLCSMLLSFMLFISFSFLYGTMAIFVLVDIIRNIKTNVNHGVLIVSVLLYVQNALVSLEDEYRYMKRTVFHVCQTLDTEAKQEARHHGQLRRRPSLVWTSTDGETAIPRRIFTGVCNSLMPYTTEIMQTSLSLVVNLSLVFFLYILVIDFQALDQFTGIGQSLMTIFTVSLPGLVGKLRSSAALQVDSERRYNRVLASVREVVDTSDVFVVCPSQIKLTAWDCKSHNNINIDESQEDLPTWV